LYVDNTQIVRFTNSPQAPTPPVGDNSTNVATTAFATSAAAFASGTQMLFINAAAPTGWTRTTTFDDSLLRIVGTAAPASGGSYGFVAAFNSQTTVGNYTLTAAQIASHEHTLPGGDAGPLQGANSPPSVYYVQSNGSPNSSNTGYTGGGGAHNHSIVTQIKYVDAMIAKKN
ncbi:MAG TPA: hypothetical protein VN825_04495, partial [Candidatus Acidoferrum sp.]|nr:hypothetical protein [Candidatus Acidoferrum sp.]